LGLRPSRIWKKSLSNLVRRAADGSRAACTLGFIERPLPTPAAQDSKSIARRSLKMSYVDYRAAAKDLRISPWRTRKIVKDRTFVPFFRKNAGATLPINLTLHSPHVK
jgi:hypothetical protein